MIIGDMAVIARGVRRMTTDVDAVVQGDNIGLDQPLGGACATTDPPVELSHLLYGKGPS